MARSRFKFRVPLMIALAAAGAAAVAQETDPASEIKIQTGMVQVTTLDSADGIPTEQFKIQRVVSYATLDLATAAGAAELKKRVTEAAKQACRELIAADPIDLSDEDSNIACVKQTTDRAMDEVSAAIGAAMTGLPRQVSISRRPG